jgi:predicted ATPase with chaperone activity
MPLLDRIDLHVDVPGVRCRDLADRRPGEPSEAIRERVARAANYSARALRGRTFTPTRTCRGRLGCDHHLKST